MKDLAREVAERVLSAIAVAVSLAALGLAYAHRAFWVEHFALIVLSGLLAALLVLHLLRLRKPNIFDRKWPLVFCVAGILVSAFSIEGSGSAMRGLHMYRTLDPWFEEHLKQADLPKSAFNCETTADWPEGEAEAAWLFSWLALGLCIATAIMIYVYQTANRSAAARETVSRKEMDSVLEDFLLHKVPHVVDEEIKNKLIGPDAAAGSLSSDKEPSETPDNPK